MGTEDRIGDKAQELKGRAKESAGAATDDDSMRAEGQADQDKAKVKQKIEDVKDTIKDKLD
jgi:uncharacterized protein YjbJ (UPF0337 family)